VNGKWQGRSRDAQSPTGLSRSGEKIATSSQGRADQGRGHQDSIMAQRPRLRHRRQRWEVRRKCRTRSPATESSPSKLSTLPAFRAAAPVSYTPSFRWDPTSPFRRSRQLRTRCDWIKIFTDRQANGTLRIRHPNTTSLLTSTKQPGKQVDGEARKHVVSCEHEPTGRTYRAANVLQNSLESIATGKSSPADAGEVRRQQIASIPQTLTR